jgi:hypothetical protein
MVAMTFPPLLQYGPATSARLAMVEETLRSDHQYDINKSSKQHQNGWINAAGRTKVSVR